MSTKQVGDIGEEVAVQYLRDADYKILERNAVYCGVEVDIIAKIGTTIVFCEVKTRTNSHYGLPIEAVTPYKVGRYVTAAKGYIVKKRLRAPEVRFDVIAVDENGVNHIEGAFDCSDAKKRF